MSDWTMNLFVVLVLCSLFAYFACCIELSESTDIFDGKPTIKQLLLLPFSVPIYFFTAIDEVLNKCGTIIVTILTTLFFIAGILFCILVVYCVILPFMFIGWLFYIIFAKREE